MPRGKENKRSSKAAPKRGRNAYSSRAKTGSVKEQVGSKHTAFHHAKSAVTKAVTTTIVRGASPLIIKSTTPTGQRRAILVSVAGTENKQQLSLSEIAEKLKDRELFPEKIERAKEFLKNLESLPA